MQLKKLNWQESEKSRAWRKLTYRGKRHPHAILKALHPCSS
ncbi:unnamed protein product [Gulo gulo]|uniref:Uncharacterized protein n=1 Tax=Gulo gulo TaxID=48420 RepID=A0A9X9LYU8_GULGU|nr:unnamed protein product [Gulo gulo]